MNEPQVPAESQRSAGEIMQEPAFRDLIKRKKTLSLVLLLVIFGVYFGFIGLLAYAPGVLSAQIGAATIGIPIGIGVIILAWVLTGIYVRWANGAYDAMVAEVRAKR